MADSTFAPWSPRISVLIPVYNGAQTLPETLESVRAQKHPNLEIIVIDDGSTDDSVAVIESIEPAARIVRQPNSGVAVARNRALREATGEIIAFIDADDIWPANKFSVQLPHLAPGSRFEMVTGTLQRFRKAAGAAVDSRVYEFAQPYFCFVLGGALIRRSVFEQLGGFDESLPGGLSEDTDWFFRALEAGIPVAIRPEVGIHYRHHETSITFGLTPTTNNFLLSVKKSLDRRRTNVSAPASSIPKVEVPPLPGSRLPNALGVKFEP